MWSVLTNLSLANRLMWNIWQRKWRPQWREVSYWGTLQDLSVNKAGRCLSFRSSFHILVRVVEVFLQLLRPAYIFSVLRQSKQTKTLFSSLDVQHGSAWMRRIWFWSAVLSWNIPGDLEAVPGEDKSLGTGGSSAGMPRHSRTSTSLGLYGIL